MRVFVLALASCALFGGQVLAMDARLEQSLKMLDPSARLEQVCGYAAMSTIRKERREFRPDRTVANAREEPRLSGHKIEANGAAFRSRKKWYALSYSCTADADNMKVLSFSYKIGAEIPESQWATYNLFY